jgi:hypothetical protein
MMTSHPALRRLAAVSLSIPLLLAACGDSGTEPVPEPSTLQIAQAALSVADGDTTTVSVRLLDQNGQAFGQPPGGQSLQWSVTDAQVAAVVPGGAWNEARVVGLRPGQTEVRASIAGLSAQAALSVAPRAVQITGVGGDGQNGPPGGRLAEPLTVRVLDRHGDGVPGVTVQFVVVAGGGSVSPASAATDAEGRAATEWTVGAEPGTHTVEARAAGLAGSPLTFSATAVAEPVTGAVSGVVTAQNGVTPIPGAVVALLAPDGGSAPSLARPAALEVPRTTTDAEGRYTLEGVPAGPQTLVARRGVFEARIDVTVPAGETVTAPTLALAPTGGGLAYVAGEFDSIQDIVRSDLGSEVERISTADLANPEVTGRYRMIFLNCGADIEFWERPVIDNLRAYVEAGGVLYVSDLELGVVEALFPDDILAVGDGDEQVIDATVVDADLRGFTGRQNVSIVYNLDGWAALDGISDRPRVLVRGDYEDIDGRTVANSPLAIVIEAGEGQVVFTTFHNNAAATADQVAVLRYFVFVGGEQATAAGAAWHVSPRSLGAPAVTAEVEAAHRAYAERRTRR